MENEASAAKLRIDFGSTLSLMFHAALRYVQVWEVRVKALERTLTELLASDDIPDDRRAALLALLHGKAGPRRDQKLLTEAEAALLTDFRAMEAPDRQAMRRLIHRLASDQQAAGGLVAAP